MSDNAQILNGLFVDALGSNEGMEKIAEVGGAYIQQILRETSFARQLLPPVNVTKQDVTRSVDHDGFVKIVDKEPDSKAMAMNFLGEPDGRYVVGERYAVPFYRIASEDFSKDETELMAYDYPITKVIEENSVKDIQEIEDRGFLKHVDAGIITEGKHVHFVGTTDELSKSAIKTLINEIEKDRLKAEVLVMANTTWNDILSWDHSLLGDDLIQKVTTDGYTYQTLVGRRVVTSIKEDMFRKNARFIDAGTETTITSAAAGSAAGVITFPALTDLSMIGVGDAVVRPNDGATATVVSVNETALTVTVDAIADDAAANDYVFTAASYKTIYAFTSPRFLGNFFVLNQTKFVIKKDYSVISWRAWEDIGIGIGNLKAHAAITLGS